MGCTAWPWTAAGSWSRWTSSNTSCHAKDVCAAIGTVAEAVAGGHPRALHPSPLFDSECAKRQRAEPNPYLLDTDASTSIQVWIQALRDTRRRFLQAESELQRSSSHASSQHDEYAVTMLVSSSSTSTDTLDAATSTTDGGSSAAGSSAVHFPNDDSGDGVADWAITFVSTTTSGEAVSEVTRSIRLVQVLTPPCFACSRCMACGSCGIVAHATAHTLWMGAVRVCRDQKDSDSH